MFHLFLLDGDCPGFFATIAIEILATTGPWAALFPYAANFVVILKCFVPVGDRGSFSVASLLGGANHIYNAQMKFIDSLPDCLLDRTGILAGWGVVLRPESVLHDEEGNTHTRIR